MKQTEKRKFGWRSKLGYALGDAGNDFTLMLLQKSHPLVFYTKVLGVSGAVISERYVPCHKVCGCIYGHGDGAYHRHPYG